MERRVEEEAFSVAGFGFGAAAAGIKSGGALDVGVVVADRPVVAAGRFTRNGFRSPAVDLSSERLAGGRIQALLVNSGNANACTGASGRRDAERACRELGRATGVPPELVAPASTGIIGVPLPMARLTRGLKAAARGVGPDGAWGFAHAIRTTDAFPKVAVERIRLGGRPVTVACIGKGAGMICPDMATLLVFVLTDARLSAAQARALSREAARSFNALSVDGDTSTNDSLYLLASGAAGNRAFGTRERRTFGAAVARSCSAVARMVAADGEGATKLVTIRVSGASSDADARRVARAVGTSTLVKAAFFGGDPNWGRIACAVGYSGTRFDPKRVRIRVGGVEVFARGTGVAGARGRAARAMRGAEFDVEIRMGAGRGRTEFVTSDLSDAYLEFNSAYST